MKKIPTIYLRDYTRKPYYVTDEINPVCAWVFEGEGVATGKLDGTCCMINDGVFFKRREMRLGDERPPDFVEVDHDYVTGKTVGWVPVGDGPEDRWHREALRELTKNSSIPVRFFSGTYELIGPKINGNPHGMDRHVLVQHGHGMAGVIPLKERTRTAIRARIGPFEGIVFHHPDGRMAKIKEKDFRPA